MKIRKIPPSAPVIPARKRVAAYARVSGGKDAMLHSLSAQISYYSAMIQNHPGWEYIGVYADEAMTGTKDSRAEFQRLLADCRTGKIDMVLTKSISRFARNTVTMLNVVRELKQLNIDVFFEKEKIHSLSGDGELMLTILSSFAQEESLSVSENCKWRIRKLFQDGELANLQFMYGYRIVKDRIVIDEGQAEIIRGIFKDYISGVGSTEIARQLQIRGVGTIRGGAWTAHRINGILKNEKYAGNALLQKKHTVDHLSKKLVLNHGLLPMYYAECTHPPIVGETVFRKAQNILAERRAQNAGKSGSINRYPFSGKIVCANCGKHYVRKTWRGRVAWNCITYIQSGKAACFSKQIPEDVLFRLSSEVLGLNAFDDKAFSERIRQILVPEFNKLVFVLADGSAITKEWQDRSRTESWNEESRQLARDRKLESLKRRNSQ